MDRGGKGLYLGGLAEFERYALHYHNIAPSTSRELEEAIARENMDTLISLKLERENAPKVNPLRVCVTNASSPVAYHLLQQIVGGALFEDKEHVAIHLYDCNGENTDQLEGVAMELVDLASPMLYEVRVCGSVKEAMDSVSVAFVLDYPYQAEESREEGAEDGGMEKSSSGVVEQKANEGSREEEEEGKEKGEREGEGGTEEKSSNEVEKQGSAPLPVIEEEKMVTDKSGDEEKQEDSAESAVSPSPPEIVAAAELYHKYGATIDFCSQKDIRVIVCGRYANTGAAMMAKAVSSIDRNNFIASPCLAEQQAKSIIAAQLSLNAADISQVALWGSTSGKVFPDLTHVRVKHFPGAVVGPDPYDLPLTRCVFDTDWLETEFAKLFEARHKKMEGYRQNGVGGAASLVEAIGLVSLAKEWREGTSVGWRCVGVASNDSEGGAYGIPVGVVFSQPACLDEGQWRPAKDLVVSDKVKVRTVRNGRGINCAELVIMTLISCN